MGYGCVLSGRRRPSGEHARLYARYRDVLQHSVRKLHKSRFASRCLLHHQRNYASHKRCDRLHHGNSCFWLHQHHTTGTNLQVIAGGSGLTDSSPSSTTYTLTVAAPTFSPAGGSYSSSQNVTVSMTTSGASILYCFDTTNACTPGTSYAGPVAVSSSGFLRAQATLPGFANSSISSAQYFIGVAPPIALVQANTTWTACSTTSSVCSVTRSEEHTSELQSPCNLVCRLLLEK